MYGCSGHRKFTRHCWHLVLIALIMGLRVTFGFNLHLAIGMCVVAVLYAWRVYRNPVRLGWI